tara:strand:- start:240 stop:953 length:714 start_codon:yes stop_codon:yes gene_type:complete
MRNTAVKEVEAAATAVTNTTEQHFDIIEQHFDTTEQHFEGCACSESPILIAGATHGAIFVQRMVSSLPDTFIANGATASIRVFLESCQNVARRKEVEGGMPESVASHCADLIKHHMQVPNNITRWGWREERTVTPQFYSTLKSALPCSKAVFASYDEVDNVEGGLGEDWELGKKDGSMDIFSISPRDTESTQKMNKMAAFLGYSCHFRKSSLSTPESFAYEDHPVCRTEVINCGGSA